jgi:hypothetical protein
MDLLVIKPVDVLSVVIVENDETLMSTPVVALYESAWVIICARLFLAILFLQKTIEFLKNHGHGG